MFSKGFFFIVVLVILIFLYFILRIKNQQTGSKSHRVVAYSLLGFLTVSGLYYVFTGSNGSHSTSSSRRHYYPWHRYSRNNASHHDVSKEKLKEYKKNSSKKSSSRRSKKITKVLKLSTLFF